MKARVKLFLPAISILFACINALAEVGDKIPNETRDSAAILYEFEYDGQKPWENYENYSKRDEKIFGKTIAQQFSLIDHHYVVYSQSENDYKPRIIKPAIYSSLTKLKHYYKSALQDDALDSSEVKEELRVYLLIGYLCYSEDTDNLEEQLEQTDSAEEIISVFNQIKIIELF